MEKIKGYNRNISGGKRPHKKIYKFGKHTLAERVLYESKGLYEYQYRVGQCTKLDLEKFNTFFKKRMEEMKHK